MPKQHQNDPNMNDSTNLTLLVGELRGEMRSVKASVDNLNYVWGEREKSATDGRRIVHEKVDLLSKDILRIGADVENLTEEIANIKPAVQSAEKERTERDGAIKFGKGIWAVGAGLFGGTVAELFHRWF